MFGFLSFRQIKKHRKATEKKGTTKRKRWVTQYVIKVRSPDTGKIFATITLEKEE